MKAGISSFAFGWGVQATSPVNEQDLMAFASRHGLEVVQVADNLPVDEFEPARIEAMVSEAERRQLQLELGARGLDESTLATYLSLCLVCRARVLRMVIDSPGYAPAPRHVVELLRNAAAAIQAAGVQLAIENHDRFPAAVLRRVVDDVGSPDVGVCLDTANSLGAGEGLEHVARLLAPVTFNVHVKDVRISRLPHQMGFVVHGAPLGRGQLPIRPVLERLLADGRCRSAIVESWTSPLADHDDTLAAERAAVEHSVDVLKAWLGPSSDRGPTRAETIATAQIDERF